MMTNETDIMLNLAEELLIAAENEKERAEEDVVTHLVCANSRLSLSNFLTGFLHRQHIEIIHPATLESLLTQCVSADARFEYLDITKVECQYDMIDQNYCLDLEHVDACIRVAQQARSIVMSDTPGY